MHTQPHPGVESALAHIAARQWFEAHEGLEDAWRDACGAQRDSLQGMIHIVVAFEHVRRGNLRGALAQWSKAQRRLTGSPDEFVGIDLARWRRAAGRFFAQLKEADAGPEAAAAAPQPERRSSAIRPTVPPPR